MPHDPRFPPTHWTLLAAAEGPARRDALDQLYRIYWQPLCAQARRFGVREDEAEDVVQEFLVGLFANGSLARADPQIGRFRSYLLGALRNFLSHRRDYQHAQKRGGDTPTLPLSAADAVSTGTDPCQFDADWAHALLDQALASFGHEMRETFGADAYEVLRDFALGEKESSYEDAARQLGITVAAVKSRIFRLRQRFREILRAEVIRTVPSETECDTELRYLCAVLEQTDR